METFKLFKVNAHSSKKYSENNTPKHNDLKKYFLCEKETGDAVSCKENRHGALQEVRPYKLVQDSIIWLLMVQLNRPNRRPDLLQCVIALS